jgi:hypothetical protein
MTTRDEKQRQTKVKKKWEKEGNRKTKQKKG